jgi:hypothetical protein
MSHGNDGIVVVAQAEDLGQPSCMVSLEALAPKITATIEKANHGMRTAVSHAIEAGRLLIQAKEACGHGKWLPWLRENVRVCDRTAQNYIQMASHAKLLEEVNTQGIADLTMAAAMKLIADNTEGAIARAIPAMASGSVDLPRPAAGACNKVSVACAPAHHEQKGCSSGQSAPTVEHASVTTELAAESPKFDEPLSKGTKRRLTPTFSNRHFPELSDRFHECGRRLAKFENGVQQYYEEVGYGAEFACIEDCRAKLGDLLNQIADGSAKSRPEVLEVAKLNFKQWQDHLRRLARWIKNSVEEPGYELLAKSSADVLAALDGLDVNLSDLAPHSPCMFCECDATRQTQCVPCQGRGWVTKGVASTASPATRAGW